ncbi:MAG: hypothetical protein ABI688_09755 [Bacteroidota bacterium]
MNQEHVISDEVLEIIQLAINRNENWMAYNNSLYFIDKEDVRFFKAKNAAEEFASDNISDYDHFKIIYVQSIADVLRQIPYGEKLNRQLADPDANGLYNPDGNAFTDALIEHIEQQQNLINKNLSIMNEKNFEYLKDNVKYHGFGETLNTDLEKQLKAGAGGFSLSYKTEVNKRGMEATLHFKKSDTTDMYFFNKYDVRTTAERNNETMAQTFYMNKGQGVTLKEAYNLLNGRAVHKELIDKQDQKYQAWVQLDFGAKDKNGNYERKQFHQNYGYDLKETLSYYPIKEMMKEDEKEKLIRSLEKGNVQMVTLETPGKDIKVFMEANPQYKTVNLYDGKMQSFTREQQQELVQKPEIKEQGKEQTQEKDLKQDAKKSIKQKPGDDLDTPKKKNSRKKNHSI